jgi:site-specific DNA-adenine methylase
MKKIEPGIERRNSRMSYKRSYQELIQLIRKERQKKEEMMQDIMRIWSVARKERKLYQELKNELKTSQEEVRGIEEN